MALTPEQQANVERALDSVVRDLNGLDLTDVLTRRPYCVTYTRDGAGLFVLARDAGEIKDRLQELRHDTHIAPSVRVWTNPPAGEQTRQLGMLPLDADLATITVILAQA